MRIVISPSSLCIMQRLLTHGAEFPIKNPLVCTLLQWEASVTLHPHCYCPHILQRMAAGEQYLQTGNEPSQYRYLVAQLGVPAPGHKETVLKY
jgi:hypothetical protein